MDLFYSVLSKYNIPFSVIPLQNGIQVRYHFCFVLFVEKVPKRFKGKKLAIDQVQEILFSSRSDSLSLKNLFLFFWKIKFISHPHRPGTVQRHFGHYRGSIPASIFLSLEISELRPYHHSQGFSQTSHQNPLPASNT